MENLTQKQADILAFIRTTQQETGAPPTREDIRAHFQFRSLTAAVDHLKALNRKGAIELLPGKSRGIRIVDENRPKGLPIVGRVAAGEPILAEQHIEDYCEIDASRFRPRADYLLQVRGQSMQDVGILNGDLLAVHRTAEASNGQIIVARVEDEVTVKRYRQRKNKVILLPENDTFDPIEIDLRHTEFCIEGLGVGVIRDKGL